MKKINVLLSTFFGYGYLTKIPGTITSAVTAVFIYIAYEILGYTDLKFSIIFFILLFFYSFYAVKDSEPEFKNKDLINLKGKTAEKLGLIGKEKAIACEVICSITQ